LYSWHPKTCHVCNRKTPWYQIHPEKVKNILKTKQYDDLPWTEGGPSPVPSPYLGLDYTTVQVGQYPFSAIIAPKSGNQYAITYGGSGNISAPS